jgi:motility quorum-sensing regulator/GCU-specific mRNA interferase toxin
MANIKSIVASMTSRQFYKSMTSHHNSAQWQDVYHVPYDQLLLYVKFTTGIVTEFILLSLKEK